MTSTRLLRTLWTISMLGLGVVLIFFAFKSDFSVAAHFSGSPMLYLIIALVAFMAEYVDSSLGMGYGTTLTPLLIIFGYSPLQIVPAVLLSEFISGISSGLLHHRLGNVDLNHGSPARKTTSILAACSVVGTVVAVLLAVSLPKEIVKTYIGFMILGIGLYILLARSH
ncbi:MAG: sulfite exporter TauE/SafE family protein, partial [Candidatus Eisenbacteria sp.]|nr:sulfite exporter TauE/SafE family protein [Candidatus Eisenbacteria bacterium]